MKRKVQWYIERDKTMRGVNDHHNGMHRWGKRKEQIRPPLTHCEPNWQTPQEPVVASAPLTPSSVDLKSQLFNALLAHNALGTLPLNPELFAIFSVCNPLGNPSVFDEEGREENWLDARLSSMRDVKELRSGSVPDSALFERSSVVKAPFNPLEAAVIAFPACVSP